jgi:hypothetical protein
MRFLIDANLPRAVIAVVQSLGHQVEFARDIGLASATDEQIAQHAAERRPRFSTASTYVLSIRTAQVQAIVIFEFNLVGDLKAWNC